MLLEPREIMLLVDVGLQHRIGEGLDLELLIHGNSVLFLNAEKLVQQTNELSVLASAIGQLAEQLPAGRSAVAGLDDLLPYGDRPRIAHTADHAVIVRRMGQRLAALKVAALRQNDVVEIGRLVQIHIDTDNVVVILENLCLLVVVAPPLNGIAGIAESDFGRLGMVQILESG